MDTVVAPPRTEGLLGSTHRRIVIGICLLLGTNAFEIVGSATAMPAVLEDLGGRTRYGWALAAPTVGSVLGAALGGWLADHAGARRSLYIGLGAFVAGLVMISVADTMTVVAAGRLVMGVGGGISFTLHLVLIARYLPDHLAPAAIATSSAVFVVPGLVGPTIVGVVVATGGWRWVFLGIIPVVVVCAALLDPELRRRAGTTPTADVTDRSIDDDRPWWGPVVLTGGLVVGVVAASSAGAAGIVVALLALVAVGVGAIASLPVGTFAFRPGLPAAVACALFVCLGYLTAEAYLPLLLRDLRGQPLWLAGMPLTVAAVFWTVGAWLQARVPRELRRRVATAGTVATSVGLALAASAVVSSVPTGVVYVGTAFGSFGCGLVFTLAQQVAVEQAGPGREGTASAAVQLANLLGIAAGTSIGGVLVARVDDLPTVLGIVLVGTAVAALLAVGPSRRLPVSR